MSSPVKRGQIKLSTVRGRAPDAASHWENSSTPPNTTHGDSTPGHRMSKVGSDDKSEAREGLWESRCQAR